MYLASASPGERVRIEAKFWSNVDIKSPTECWMWKGPVTKKAGYGWFKVYNSKKRSAFPISAHRLVWEIYYKASIPTALCCCHSCDVRTCVNPLHIFIGTRSHNRYDTIRKGKNLKISNEEAIIIVEKLLTGYPPIILAKMFGYSDRGIEKLVKRPIIIQKFGVISLKGKCGQTVRRAPITP
jgi:hypothetical protein